MHIQAAVTQSYLQERKAAEKVRREARLNGNAHEMARYDKGSTLLNTIMSKKRDRDTALQQVREAHNEACYSFEEFISSPYLSPYSIL